MDYLDFFSQRLSELRTQKGVSARDMSLSLGQCESYINKIENHKSLPSMNVFFYICDYLDIQPKDFFDISIESPTTTNELLAKMIKLNPTIKIISFLSIFLFEIVFISFSFTFFIFSISFKQSPPQFF